MNNGKEKCLKDIDIPLDFRTFFDLANIFLIVLCKSQKVAMINPKGCQILGKSEKEIDHKNWFQNFIPSADRRKTLAVFERLMKGDIEPVEIFKNRILTAKGERPFLWHNSYLKDHKGKIRYTFSAGVDIADLKKQSPKPKSRVR